MDQSIKSCRQWLSTAFLSDGGRVSLIMFPQEKELPNGSTKGLNAF
jgi:hypothetical protein